jgi:hypothetical protein
VDDDLREMEARIVELERYVAEQRARDVDRGKLVPAYPGQQGCAELRAEVERLRKEHEALVEVLDVEAGGDLVDTASTVRDERDAARGAASAAGNRADRLVVEFGMRRREWLAERATLIDMVKRCAREAPDRKASDAILADLRALVGDTESEK